MFRPPVEALTRWVDRREWRTRRDDLRGSEMMLEFARDREEEHDLHPGEAEAGFPRYPATIT